MIALNQLGMAYGQKLLFYDVTLKLNSGHCYALIGANGCGKSTFFKLITLEEEPCFGGLSISKDSSIGWLKQDQFRYENIAIRDIVLQGKPPLWRALQEKEALLSSTDWNDAMGHRFGELEETIADNDGYTAIAAVENILAGLGIAAEYFDKPLKAVSGGYKLRVLLAQTLFQNPSILLLDEPTNHLDILSIRWLEKFLKNEFKGLVVFISHDMGFIDNLADYILDVDYGEIRSYRGKYQQFLAEKTLFEQQKISEKKAVTEKIAHLQKFITKFGAKASKATQAKSKEKMIEKIEIPDVKNSSRLAPNFQFHPEKISGKQVLKVIDLAKSFKSKTLFKQFNVDLRRGEKIVVMGVNGVGKSTFIKILTQSVKPDNGSVEFGHGVQLSYCSQDHHELLNRHVSVLHWLQETVTDVTEQQLRKVLGQMLFTKDCVAKDILSLSGGEAARLLIAKVILEAPNLIILDEPTNHMDLETIEALADALQKYTGTVIFVSHNRHFIDKIATRVLYFAPNSPVKDYKGSYSEFEKIYID